jgi:hypothetical protein
MAKLSSKDRHKVDGLVSELHFLKARFRPDPFDPKKRTYSSIFWALEQLGVIEPHEDSTHYAVWEGSTDGCWVRWCDTSDVLPAISPAPTTTVVVVDSDAMWTGSKGDAQGLQERMRAKSGFLKRYSVASVPNVEART